MCVYSCFLYISFVWCYFLPFLETTEKHDEKSENRVLKFERERVKMLKVMQKTYEEASKGTFWLFLLFPLDFYFTDAKVENKFCSSFLPPLFWCYWKQKAFGFVEFIFFLCLYGFSGLNFCCFFAVQRSNWNTSNPKQDK